MVSVEFPSHWETKRLEDVCEILNGDAFDSSEFTENKSEGKPVIRIGDLGTGETELNHTGDFTDRYIVENGDYLISMDRHFHIYSWKGGESLLNQRVCKIHSIDDAIIAEFLKLYLEIPLQEIKDNIEYTTVPHLSMKDLRGIEVPIPPLPEQKEITQSLSSIVDRLESARNAEENAREIIDKSLDACVSGIINKNSIPSDWEYLPISECCDVNSINRKPKQEFPDRNFKYVTVSCVDGEVGKITETKLEAGEDAPSRAKREMRSGDVIVSTVRPYLRAFAIVPDELAGEICSTAFAVLSPRDNVNSRYLWYAVRSNDFVSQLKRKQRGASYPAVGITDVKESSIVLPPLEEQQEIVDHLNSIEERTAAIRNASDRMEEIFEILPTAIRTKAFRGELRKPDSINDGEHKTDAQLSITEF